MKIITLTAENIKRLTAVQISPDGNIVQITGANGQGKTSVLDAIWWALAGTSNVQDKPIHDDAEEARIELDMGEIVVTRTFRLREEGKITTQLSVRNADGAKFSSGQTILDGLLGALTFDPLSFKRMKPAEQYETLKRFVPDIDFETMDAEQKKDYETRTEINRRAKEQRASAETIILPDDTPTETVSVNDLMKELEDIQARNNERQAEINRRTAMQNILTSKADEIEDLNRAAQRLQEQIAEVNDKIEAVQKFIDDPVNNPTELPPVEDMESVAEIRAKISSADEINDKVRLYQKRREHEVEADNAEKQSAAITAIMEERRQKVNKAIEGADMPVDGLGLAEGAITFNGLPFDQAADSEQLRVSCAIAMQENQKLRVIRVRDGSLLDEQSLTMLAKMADEKDYQVWIERVDTSGDVGFVIEDGHLRGAPPPEPDPERQNKAETKEEGKLV